MTVLIYKKMSAVMKDIGAITKDQKNVAQGFKFRGVDQFVNALYPCLVKHEVFMTPRVTSASQEIREVERSSGKKGYDKHVNLLVEYDFFAEDGSKVTVGPIAGEGLDSGDKATNKALSAALKYALIQTFTIPTEDMAEADLDTPVITKHSQPKSMGTIGVDSIVTGTITGTLTSDQASLTTMLAEAPKKKVSFSKKSLTTVAKPATVEVTAGDEL